MAQSASSPKVDELRIRLRADPKSRLFYPLAEELRKIGQFTEAEQVLRGGLGSHPTYLSAWVSLGRVLRELKQDDGAIEALSKALTLDPGNVVAARLLADAYMTRGDKLEAIKKYKLVHALLPSDQDLEGLIARLDQELNPPAPPPPPPPAPEPEPEPEPPAAAPEPEPEPEPPPLAAEPPPRPHPGPPVPIVVTAAVPPAAFVTPELFDQTEPNIEPTVETPLPTFPAEDESPWGPPAVEQAQQALAHEEEVAAETGDAEPMSAAHEESPFEDPGVEAGYGSDALMVEHPEGFHLASAPLAAEVAEPFGLEEPPVESEPPIAPEAEDAEDAEIFALATEAIVGAEETTETLTMADLYARQGFTEDARKIYEHILQRDPGNDAVREKLANLGRSAAAPPAPLAEEAEEPMEEPVAGPPGGYDPRAEKIRRLENWLAKVTRV